MSKKLPDDERVKILDIAEQLQNECSKHGFNAFQPGAVKEIKMAGLLGHNWISSKKNADACAKNDESKKYEYLCGTENGSGQLDRMFKDDKNDEEQHRKHLDSMKRIERNAAFFLGYTNSDTTKPLDILRIYEVPTEEIKKESEIQLEKSTNKISHVGFNEKFAKEHGKLVYDKNSCKGK